MGLEKKAFCWLRRDLRLHDNHALYKALASGLPVQVLFIFDTRIIDSLPANDPRISIIYDQLLELEGQLKKQGSSLLIKYGDPKAIFEQIIKNERPAAIYANEDYEPYALDRDRVIQQIARENGIGFYLVKDQVIFSPKEILKPNGQPYSVFTPYFKKWHARFFQEKVAVYPSEKLFSKLVKSGNSIPVLKNIGFSHVKVQFNKTMPSKVLLDSYEKNRDFPSIDGTSRLSISLRFGMISIRELAIYARDHQTYLSELAWREFYMMILYHFPHVVTQSFKKKYDNIMWLNNEENFKKWKHGQTGYPLVDAGMRQLYETGYMHNRLRMLTASFLTKHLLTDWRRGEAWFAEKLYDYELASNNGGWQWAAGSGCDAAPYFRIFNPAVQTKKFDSEMKFIRKWVPEFDSLNYVKPVVDHKFARQRALEVFKSALNKE